MNKPWYLDDSFAGPWSALTPERAAADAATPSALLRRIDRVSDTRSHARRLIIAGVVVALLVTICFMTVTRRWPDQFPLNLIYLAHDTIYLPLKGWLWNALFPWSLIIWVPVAAVGALALWAWISGADPVRIVQRRLVLLFVVARPPAPGAERNRRVAWLLRIARWSSTMRLGTAYIETVVRNHAAVVLDNVERRLIDNETVPHDTLARAFSLVDATLGLDKALRPNDDRRKIEGLLDLALLSHTEAGQHAIRRLATVLEGSTVVEGNDLQDGTMELAVDLLHARTDGRSSTACIETIGRVIAALERLAFVRAGAAPSPFGKPAEVMVNRIHVTSLFAFFAAPSAPWAELDIATLNAHEHIWQALTLSGLHRDHANALALMHARSRLATCRYLQQRCWRPDGHQAIAGLWPENSQLLWSFEGAASAAGGD